MVYINFSIPCITFFLSSYSEYIAAQKVVPLSVVLHRTGILGGFQLWEVRFPSTSCKLKHRCITSGEITIHCGVSSVLCVVYLLAFSYHVMGSFLLRVMPQRFPIKCITLPLSPVSVTRRRTTLWRFGCWICPTANSSATWPGRSLIFSVSGVTESHLMGALLNWRGIFRFLLPVSLGSLVGLFFGASLLSIANVAFLGFHRFRTGAANKARPEWAELN